MKNKKSFIRNIRFFAVAILAAVIFPLCSCALNIERDYYENTDKLLVNSNASKEAKQLFAFLNSVYGKYTLAGQYTNTFIDFGSYRYQSDVFKIEELAAVNSVTGKYPAVLGLDFIESMRKGDDAVLMQAKQWYGAGGIVTFCWHWSIGEVKRGFYASETDFDLDAAFNGNNKLYSMLLADIDALAGKLKELADMPIIFRPLHEVSGGWFWWGAHGKDNYLKLWKLLYERLTNTHSINNLIWAWNGEAADWYVGDGFCDIIAADRYPSKEQRENKKLFDRAYIKAFAELYAVSTQKMAALSEVGVAPDLNKMNRRNSRWLFFCVWQREFVVKKTAQYTYSDEYSEQYTSINELVKTYSHQNTVTLDRLSIGADGYCLTY